MSQQTPLTNNADPTAIQPITPTQNSILADNFIEIIKSLNTPLNPLQKKKAWKQYIYQQLAMINIWDNKIVLLILGTNRQTLEMMIKNRSLSGQQLCMLGRIVEAECDNTNVQGDLTIRKQYTTGCLPLLIPHQFQHLSYPQNPQLLIIGLKIQITENPQNIIASLQLLLNNPKQLINKLGNMIGLNIVLHQNRFPDLTSYEVHNHQGATRSVHLIMWSQNEFPDLIRIQGKQYYQILFNWYFELQQPPKDINVVQVEYEESNVKSAKLIQWQEWKGDELQEQFYQKIKFMQDQQEKFKPKSNNDIIKTEIDGHNCKVIIQFSDQIVQEIHAHDLQKLCEQLDKKRLTQLFEQVEEVPLFTCDKCKITKKNVKFLKISELKHHMTLKGKHFCKMLEVLGLSKCPEVLSQGKSTHKRRNKNKFNHYK